MAERSDSDLSTPTDSNTDDEGETEDEPEPAYDIETYRHALQEARHTLDQQLQAFNDVNDKAWRIVQLNGIIATVYIAAVANALNSLAVDWMSAGVVTLGLIAMAVSVFLATEGQEATTVAIGQSSDAFRSLRKTDPDEITYLYTTLEDYESWIDEVNRKTEQNGETVNTAKRLLLIGVVLIISGTVLAIDV